ncbi:basic salivary proline-rich protein 2-like [Anomalospiza imberbis]|uniref:basic salivary proline-rich protein 2-like n=1 Tax=Anomalospiza imberbis TaxID=187417 RepID=UPI00358E973F
MGRGSPRGGVATLAASPGNGARRGSSHPVGGATRRAPRGAAPPPPAEGAEEPRLSPCHGGGGEAPPGGGRTRRGRARTGEGPEEPPPEPEGSLRPSQGLLKALQRLVSSGFGWGQDPPHKPPRQRWCWGPRPESGAVSDQYGPV